MKKALTPKQRLFIHEYLVDLNATQAAIRAGYSRKTAEQYGHQLLKKTLVAKSIQAARERRENKAIMTREEILEELTLIGRSDIQNYVEIDDDTGAIRAKGFEEMPKGSSRALQSINEERAIKENSDGNSVTVYDKVNFKMHDKLRALELLGKNQGMFPNKLEGALTLTGKLSIEEMKRSAKEAENAGADG